MKQPRYETFASLGKCPHPKIMDRERSRMNREQDCIDFDECVNNQHNCDVEKSSCANTPGSFDCPCIMGYKMIDQECQDRL